MELKCLRTSFLCDKKMAAFMMPRLYVRESYVAAWRSVKEPCGQRFVIGRFNSLCVAFTSSLTNLLQETLSSACRIGIGRRLCVAFSMLYFMNATSCFVVGSARLITNVKWFLLDCTLSCWLLNSQNEEIWDVLVSFSLLPAPPRCDVSLICFVIGEMKCKFSRCTILRSLICLVIGEMKCKFGR